MEKCGCYRSTMYLSVTRRVGNVLFGRDGYGHDVEVTVPHALADEVGQLLCYQRTVRVSVGDEKVRP